MAVVVAAAVYTSAGESERTAAVVAEAHPVVAAAEFVVEPAAESGVSGHIA